MGKRTVKTPRCLGHQRPNITRYVTAKISGVSDVVSLLCEGALSQVLESLLDLLARVHDKGAIASDRLSQGFAGDQKEAGVMLPSMYCQMIAICQYQQGGLVHGCSPPRGINTEGSLSFKDIGECCVTRHDGLNEGLLGRDGHIHVDRIGRDIRDRPTNPVCLTGDQPDAGARGTVDIWNARRGHFLIAGSGHL